MRLLLDTHILLWWLIEPGKLSRTTHDFIKDFQDIIFVSAATIWEISIKKALGKLQVPDDLEEALLTSRFEPLSISIPHAILAGQLPPHHTDPFDRLLVAQAKIEGLTLLTRDPKQQLYDIQTRLA